jgi:branched-subunit amino acid ABC-type transport system permease component
MRSWAIYILVQGGVVAAASVGLGLHLRLVRFFDLSWALWAIGAAFVGVHVASSSSSPILGIVAGTLTAILLGMLEDGLAFQGILTSYVPAEAIERFSFSGALAAYLAVSSLVEVLGMRERVTIPSTKFSWFGLSMVELIAAVSCWAALGICALIRFSNRSLRLRALLENSRACPPFGMRVQTLSLVVGGLSGFLTGAAASSFGLLYFADSSTGFSLMLLAVVPCILIGPRSSRSVALAAIIIVSIVGAIRFYFGDSASQFVVQGMILGLLVARPAGFVQSRLREV